MLSVSRGEIVDPDGQAHGPSSISKKLREYAERLREWNPDLSGPIVILGNRTLETAAAVLAANHLGLMPLLIDTETSSKLSQRAAATIVPDAPVFLPSSIQSFNEHVVGRHPAHPVSNEANRPLPKEGLLFLTSGTTGTPKAAALTLTGFQSVCRRLENTLPLQDVDRLYSPLSLSHSYGFLNLIYALSRGATLILDHPAMFQDEFLAKLREVRPSILSGVPLHGHFVLGAESLPESLTSIWIAGDALPPSSLRRLATRHGSLRIFVMYGQTEATSRISILAPDKLPEKAGAAGHPIPGINVRIQQDDNLTPGSGEIVVEGPDLMLGYWPLAGRPPTSIHTGDLGFLDQDGDLWVIGRSGHLIIVNGERIAPSVLEGLACEYPGVREALVQQLEPDGRLQLIVVAESPRLDAHDVRRHVNSSLGRPLVSQVAVVPRLPRLPSGKLDRSVPLGSGLGAQLELE